jgi:hypothetical protein
MRAIGYIKAGTTVAIKFSTPMMFDRRYRTFEPVKAKGFDLSALA